MVLYRDARDRRHFLELLGEVVERYRLLLHAYVLMDNHYHLLVQTPEGNLSRAMQWLNLGYAAWFNARHRRSGPVFQRPYKAVAVEDGAWAYELSLYLHLNPLRIKGLGLSRRERQGAKTGVGAPPSRAQVAERLRRLRTYPWSSYRAYAGYVQAPPWLSTAEIARRAGAGRQESSAAAYRADVRGRLRQGAAAPRLEALRDSLAIGGAAFLKRVQSLGRGTGVGRELAGKRQLRARLRTEQIIAAVEQVKGERWEQFRERYGDPGAALVMWVARRHTGLTLRQIGAALGGIDYAAVSMAVQRLETRARHDRAVANLQQQNC